MRKIFIFILGIIFVILALFLFVMIRPVCCNNEKYNVDRMNDKVRDEINKLFMMEDEIIIYLANQKADIEPGEDQNIAFGIRNINKTNEKFNYFVKVNDENIEKKCGINEATANSWIVTGGEDNINILPDDTYHGIVRFRVPVGSPLCVIRFHLTVESNEEEYAQEFFDIDTT